MTAIDDDLLTFDDLAEKLKMSVDKAKRLAHQHDWPRLEFSRKTIRFSPAHVVAILKMHDVEPDRTAGQSLGIDGQTERSRKRSA